MLKYSSNKMENRKAEYMLEWTRPQPEDGRWIRKITAEAGAMESDVSFANLYLLRTKYDTEICRYRDFLIRRYHGSGARNGYTFPLGRGDVPRALHEIEQDAAARGERLRFAFLTADQKKQLEEWMPGRFVFCSDAGDSDYIYSCPELAALAGKAYHKKKNHVSKFKRTFPKYEYAQMGRGNWEDAARVADAWYYEHLQQEDESQVKEYQAIKEALDLFEELELMGGLIYVNQTPAAMTIASMTGPSVCDIHFEKAVGTCALYGGYAAINQFFAQDLSGVEWINREEDIGIEGLRRAKQSYHPKMLLKKYGASERDEAE